MPIIMQVIPSQFHAITVVATDNTQSSFYLKVDGKRVIIDGNYEFATVEAAAAFGEQISIQFYNEARGFSTERAREFTLEE